jgi:DNA-binding CsgD family transcriptional regulator
MIPGIDATERRKGGQFAACRPWLTQREIEIVQLIALGYTTPEIAGRLVVSPDTVRSHVRNAMAKAQARTRAHLAALALAHGFIAAPPSPDDIDPHSSMRVLIAEDERYLAQLVAEGLRKHAMAVDVDYDGAAAKQRLTVKRVRRPGARP